MPVLITGATGFIGRALAHRLLEEGAQVRAYVRRDDAALRAAGAHIAIGPLHEVEPLEAALTGVHTIVHLTGGWWPEPGVSHDLLNRDSTETAVIAAKAARVARFVFVSFPGADPAARNAFLAAKGKAEEHILGSRLPHVVFRCAPVVGEGAPLARALQRWRVVSSGSTVVSAIALEDVVDALVAADARDEHVDGIWDLGGPEPVPLQALVRWAGGRSSIIGGPPKVVADLLGRDIGVDPQPAASRFGLSLRPALPATL